ncbi:hypothetical protein OG819_42825 [Streptomyces sp. NBC_01549]|uniref:hypothetical protein n=1 Tax=Streptomyces sp. NBC_01549 TaxID=2975874 RepID=UPI00225B743E|nr:hypothetical protein [Streptomyces sp. NBC_01549]MCX4596152.1 hypothetical protein [Streptomyces sp. NBC_01549]
MSTDPRIAVLSALSSPGWHPVPEAHGMPWDEAEQLLTAYDASRAAAAPAVPSAPADRASLVEGPQTVTHNANELLRKLATAERIRENADFHLGQEMARRQLAEKEVARLTTGRAAVLNGAAQHLYTALFPAVYDDMGQKAAEGVNRAVSELRRLADEPASTPSRVAGEAPQPETQVTPCSQPNPCEDGGDPCATHEREQAHAEGDHGLCGPDCTADRCTCDSEDHTHDGGCPAAVSQPGKEG